MDHPSEELVSDMNEFVITDELWQEFSDIGESMVRDLYTQRPVPLMADYEEDGIEYPPYKNWFVT